MVGVALAKSLYAIPTWTKTVALVREHDALREAIGGECPPVYAAYGFAGKLRHYSDLLDACIARMLDRLHHEKPDIGRDLAIDVSDLPAYANGQRTISKGGRERAPDEYSDRDASWGHRSVVSTRKGTGFYGYRIHPAVCVRTGLPVSWEVASANAHESTFTAPLIDATKAHGFAPLTVAMDKGYDIERVYDGCEGRNVRSMIPCARTPAVKAGKTGPPTCEHGEWRFAGADLRRQAAKWRCPTGECSPASRWVKAGRLNPLVPRDTKRWKSLYRGRAAVEREFGRLKTSGRYCRSACEGSSGSSSTPT